MALNNFVIFFDSLNEVVWRIVENEPFFKQNRIAIGCVVCLRAFPAIVDENIFDEVNTRLQVSKRTAAHNKTKINYLLSGKLICGNCRTLMTGDSAKGKLGKIYYYYKCFAKKKDKQVCNKKSITKDYIEEIILSATQEFMQNTDLPKLAKKNNRNL